MLTNRRVVSNEEYLYLNNYDPIEDKIRSRQWFLYLNIVLIIINIARLAIGIFNLLDIRSKCTPTYSKFDDKSCQAYGLDPNNEPQMEAYVCEMIIYMCTLTTAKIIINYISIRAYQEKSYWKINLLFWIYSIIIVCLLLFQTDPVSILEYMTLLFGALKLRPIFKVWEQSLSQANYYYTNGTVGLSDGLINNPFTYNYGGHTPATSTRSQSFRNHASSYSRMDLDYPSFVKDAYYIEMNTYPQPR